MRRVSRRPFESRGFSPATPVFSHMQEMLTWWLDCKYFTEAHKALRVNRLIGALQMTSLVE